MHRPMRTLLILVTSFFAIQVLADQSATQSESQRSQGAQRSTANDGGSIGGGLARENDGGSIGGGLARENDGGSIGGGIVSPEQLLNSAVEQLQQNLRPQGTPENIQLLAALPSGCSNEQILEVISESQTEAPTELKAEADRNALKSGGGQHTFGYVVEKSNRNPKLGKIFGSSRLKQLAQSEQKLEMKLKVAKKELLAAAIRLAADKTFHDQIQETPSAQKRARLEQERRRKKEAAARVALTYTSTAEAKKK